MHSDAKKHRSFVALLFAAGDLRRSATQKFRKATLEIYRHAMKFVWDADKADANRRKHGVEFDDATTVFGDPLAGTFLDPDHSIGELRLITVGKSSTGRLLVVSHTENSAEIRIISARPATAHERKKYES